MRVQLPVAGSYNATTKKIRVDPDPVGYDFEQVITSNNMIIDPRYGQEATYTSPWAARIGLKFIF